MALRKVLGANAKCEQLYSMVSLNPTTFRGLVVAASGNGERRLNQKLSTASTGVAQC